jgi:hypothetical protein
MSLVKIDQKRKRVEIKEFEIENEIVFNFFDRVSSEERDETLFRALYIGTLALMEDRLSSFFAKTSSELGVQLESLKMIFEMKKELFFKSAIKGVLAEDDLLNFLNSFFSSHLLKDTASLTGNAAGIIPKNKTGDIVCHVNGDQSLKIVIECKFDKSIKLGDIASKDIFIKKSDTAWSQLLEAQANRDGKIALIVFDASLVDSSILNKIENVRFIPSVGLVAIIDSQKGDYRNLAIAYMLARDIAINAKSLELDKDILSIIINRIIKDINETLTIKSLVESNIDTNKKILSQLDKSLLLMEFNQRYLAKFLKDGKLNKLDLLEFYSGEDIKDRFKVVEKEINQIY